MRHVWVIFVVIIVLASPFTMAQTTTGRLMGTTVDDSGAILPGVAITIQSPALIGGSQSKTTDRWGEFSFLGLAPGEYTVAAELVGYIPQERARVKVSVGGAAALTIAMPEGSFSGEIDVIDETPVVDPTQVNTGQVFDLNYMQNSAISSVNRNYLVFVNQTAGVTGGAWVGVPQSKVFGSTIGENAYFIDGVDTTDPTMATATVTMNFDAIGEIQFQTGGYEAEYGRATGGIMNLVTRSGGNRFSGTLDARYRNGSFQESGDNFDASELDTSFQQYSATLGGPILRDRLWFFTSYEWTNNAFTPNGSPTTREESRQNYMAKFTWQIDSDWRLTARYSGAPSSTDNWASSRWTTPEATGYNQLTNTILSAELSSVLSDSLLWNTTLGAHRYDTEIYPQSGDLQTIGHYNYDTGLSTHNYGNQQYWGSDRNDFTTDLSWFVDDLAGSHEFKFGVEYSDIALPDDGLCSTGTPNGERCSEGVAGFFFHDIEDGGSTLPVFMDEILGLPQANYDGAVSTAFVQDAWRLTRDLTVKIGLRYDTAVYDSNEGDQIVDMGMFQPRLGFAWDIAGDAKNLLRGSWGRFMHPGSLAAPGWATTTTTSSSFWYSCSGAVPLFFGIEVSTAEECAAAAADFGIPYRSDNEGWDPLGWMLPPWEIYGSEPTVIAPGLRATYADELILAFEREVGARSSIELTYVDKKTRDIYDDTCNGNVPTPSPDADCSYFVIANVPGLERDYEAFILRYETRGLPWLTLLASYTYSSSKGSVGYSQGVNEVADIYPCHFDNRYGYLSGHRAHQLKLNGFFNIKGDWTAAFDSYWVSPFTWTPYENRVDNPEIPRGSHYLEPRGNREANSNYQLDLQITKGFHIGQTRLVLIGSVLNVLSSERPTGVCWHISGCAGIEMGEPINWQTPRRYEVGFRVEF